MTCTILYLEKTTSSPELTKILPPSRFEVIAVQSVVAAHKQLQSGQIDCIIIDDLSARDIPLSEILSLLTQAHPHPIILIDGSKSAEIPISYPFCEVIRSEHLDVLPERIDGIIEQRSVDIALSEQSELQGAILDIIHGIANADNNTDVYSLVFEKLQNTNLFEYVWLGNYEADDGVISIEYPSEGRFSIRTVSDILQISDDAIFDKAIQTHDIQSARAPVRTRETAQVEIDNQAPSYQLNSVVIPVNGTAHHHELIILATYRTRAFDTPEKQLLTTLRDVIQFVLSADEANLREPEQTREEIDKFVATLVHELRSPLGIAQAYLDIGRDNGENADEAFEKVSDALTDLEQTIDDLASMAKNRMAVELEECTLEPLVQEVWESIDTNDASIQIDASMRIMADPTLLKILFRNLLTNAIQHGGDDCSILIGELSHGFFIEDTGHGIPDDIQDEIFTRGFSDGEGLGVGLALVNDIVDSHEWEISIDSEVGRGTRVEISGVIVETTEAED